MLDLFLNLLDNQSPSAVLAQLEEWKQSKKTTVIEFVMQVELALNKHYKQLCLREQKSAHLFLQMSKRRAALVRIKRAIVKQKIALNEYFAAQRIFLNESNFFKR